MEVVNVHQAKSQLSALIQKVLIGEEVIIARNNNPVIQLIPYKKKEKSRKLGQFNGQMEIVGDWADLDKEIEEMFENSKIFPDEKSSN